jgi:DNA-binding response OmpR family regulator
MSSERSRVAHLGDVWEETMDVGRCGAPLGAIAIVTSDRAQACRLHRWCLDAGFEPRLIEGACNVLEPRTIDAVRLLIVGPFADHHPAVVTCGALRERGFKSPILWIGNDDNVASEAAAFHAGADAFVPSPIVFPQLELRLRALLRRDSGLYLTTQPSESDGLVMRQNSMTVTIAGEPVALTPTEWRILAYLVHRPGTVISAAELAMNCAPTPCPAGDTGKVRVHIFNLCRKLGPFGKAVVNVSGLGYRFDAHVIDSSSPQEARSA